MKPIKSKTGVFLILLLLVCAGLHPTDKKLRFSGSAGAVIQNDPVGHENGLGGTLGGGASIVYPVSSKRKPVNVELGITNRYNLYPYEGDYAQTLRFGFGVRVFLNSFSRFRPYFTHDICSHFVWVSDRNHHASTLGILLGAGIDIPLGSAGPDEESSSLFFDLSYNTFTLADFTASPEETRFFAATAGFAWLLRKKPE